MLVAGGLCRNCVEPPSVDTCRVTVRGHPRPLAGRSLRPSGPSFTRCCLRFGIHACACQQRRLAGHGQPLTDSTTKNANHNVLPVETLPIAHGGPSRRPGWPALPGVVNLGFTTAGPRLSGPWMARQPCREAPCASPPPGQACRGHGKSQDRHTLNAASRPQPKRGSHGGMTSSPGAAVA
jgi:hypothetical protein